MVNTGGWLKASMGVNPIHMLIKPGSYLFATDEIGLSNGD